MQCQAIFTKLLQALSCSLLCFGCSWLCYCWFRYLTSKLFHDINFISVEKRFHKCISLILIPLSANPTKWSKTLKQLQKFVEDSFSKKSEKKFWENHKGEILAPLRICFVFLCCLYILKIDQNNTFFLDLRFMASKSFFIVFVGCFEVVLIRYFWVIQQCFQLSIEIFQKQSFAYDLQNRCFSIFCSMRCSIVEMFCCKRPISS